MFLSYNENIMGLEPPIKSKIPGWAVILAGLLLVTLGYLSSMAKNSIVTDSSGFSVIGPNGEKKNLHYGPWPSLQNDDFFGRVKKDFLESKKDFIEVDLSTMRLNVYKNGEVKLEVPILTKGKKGSWWETPAGVYSIKTKENKHFSSIGQVTMPWSMQFQGNFFIHGWPYRDDGSPVISTYSGGCVRLSTEDANKVYSLASVGMPVLVFESDFNSDNFSYRPKTPEISGRAYLAADLKNNFVFIEKNSSEVMPIASVTKLMTSIVATERINLDKKISISKEAIVKTSKPRLTEGDEVVAYDLLFPLLEESSNEAAEALAHSFGRSVFIRAMNENAKSLGMEYTIFTDPSGLDEGNVSNAEDLFNLAKYLLNNRSFILDVTAGREKNNAYSQVTFSNLQNFNGFAEDSSFVGGKIGMTPNSSSTMLSVFDVYMREEKRPVVIIVMNSSNSIKDTEAILKYVKEEYE